MASERYPPSVAKHRDFAHGGVFYASFTDALQEYISTIASNIRLTAPTTTSVRVSASAESGQAAIGIEGLWRYRDDATDATVSGGAGVKDIYVVAVNANDFVGAGDDPDETVYDFELRSVVSGGTPSSVEAYRKIGEADWDGTKITGLRQIVGAGDQTLPAYPTAARTDTPALVARGIASQAADIFIVENSAGTDLFNVQPDGDVVITGDLTISGGDLTLGGTAVSAFIKTLLDDADAATARSTLGLVLGTDILAKSAFSAFIQTLIDDADASTARGTLGLGTIATQAAASVTITGGSITGITDLAVADGGTGSSTAADARTALAAAGTGVANTFSQKQTLSGEIEIDGAFNHDGASFGVFSVAPVAQRSAYTNGSGLTEDRSLPAAPTLNDVIKFVIALAADSKAFGFSA